MFRNFCVASLLILALCSAGAASAVPLDPDVAEAAEGGFLSGLWDRLLDWMERLAGGEDDGLTLQRTEGCHIDPNGHPICGGN